MGRSKLVAVLTTIVMAASACSGDDDDGDDAARDGALATPTFSEDDAPAIRSSDVPEEPGPPTDAEDGGTGPTTTDVRSESVSFDDPVGDATPGAGTGEPPPWTDLAGGALERRGNAYRLTIRLGGEAPTRSPGPETMNIASYFDIDGDGAVDYELWVNLGSDGWGPVWYDDRGNAARGDDANVTVVVEGAELRLLFPDVMLDEPDRLRFSLASEYGALTTIGSTAARRDDAPDDDRAVSFP